MEIHVGLPSPGGATPPSPLAGSAEVADQLQPTGGVFVASHHC